MRNFYWVNTRVNGKPQEKDYIETAEGVEPYPPANSVVTDKPVSDSGSDFGRIGRVHELVGAWTVKSLLSNLGGIAAIAWIKF